MSAQRDSPAQRRAEVDDHAEVISATRVDRNVNSNGKRVHQVACPVEWCASGCFHIGGIDDHLLVSHSPADFGLTPLSEDYDEVEIYDDLEDIPGGDAE